jgi:GNAT superfamily N-acetyltransferase
VHARTWQAAYAGIVDDAYLAALDVAELARSRRQYFGTPGVHTLLAEEDGVIAGFVTFGRARPGGGEDGELYAIYVDPARQGRGIGRALFERARDGLRDDGFPRMNLWVLSDNRPSRRFYERCGMTPTVVTDVFTPRGSTQELPEMRYALDLDDGEGQ